MAISAVVAGAYTGTFSGSPLNYTRRGYNLNFAQKYEQINETDLYGEMLVDAVYRGGALSIDTICRVYSSITNSALTPWAAVWGRVYSSLFPIGSVASITGQQPLVLTAVANTPAALAGPVTLTAKVVIAADQLQMVFNSQARDVPLRFDVYVQDNSGVGTLFTTS